MGSKVVTALGVIVILLAVALDISRHGHHDDGEIADAVRENVDDAPGVETLAGLDVRAQRRTVYLDGLIDTREERSAATAAALRAPGVLTLVNNLRVDQVLEELLLRLKEQLDADPTEGEFEYRIAPDGHTVTLDGWVPVGEEDLREALENTVLEVPGVRRVINNLSVGRPQEDVRRVQELILDILRLGNIYFDYNKATIRPESLDSVRRIAAVLEQYPDVRLSVEGHTDSIASEGYNQRLSERRAESVAAALVEFGVAARRIEPVGFGESRPIAPNDTPEGRADNRRIEFRVLRADGSPAGEND